MCLKLIYNIYVILWGIKASSDFKFSFFYFTRFALIYQLTKPVVKKATTQTSTPDGGTKVPATDKKPSEDSSGTG